MAKNGKEASKLLIEEPPLQVLPTLACKIGLNNAIVLQQVHYWIVIAKKAKDDRKFIDGQWWVYNTYQEWQENFPWWSLPTIKRAILSLEESGLLISKEMNKQDWDHTKWYTINYDKLDDVTDCIKMIPSSVSDEGDQSDQSDSLLIESETTTETTTETEEEGKQVMRAEIFKAYEAEIGMLTPFIADAIEDELLSGTPSKWIVDSFHEAAQQNKRNWKYCAAILKRWVGQGNQNPVEKPTRKGEIPARPIVKPATNFDANMEKVQRWLEGNANV